jgi:hypothetical protein
VFKPLLSGIQVAGMQRKCLEEADFRRKEFERRFVLAFLTRQRSMADISKKNLP